MSNYQLTRVLGAWEGYAVGTAQRFEVGVKGPTPQNSWVRKTVRIIAIAANALILVPYAMYVLLIAFNIDCDAWPIVGLGVLCLIAGLLAAIALLRPSRGAAYLISAVTCSVLQIILLAHGVVEMLDKPDMMTWSGEAMFSGPIILVPVLSLVAFIAHERRWSPPIARIVDIT